MIIFNPFTSVYGIWPKKTASLTAVKSGRYVNNFLNDDAFKVHNGSENDAGDPRVHAQRILIT